MNPSITNRRLAKARFFAIYTFSVLLIVLLLSSFFLPDKNTAEKTASASPNNDRAALIEWLHLRMAPLQRSAMAISEAGATPGAWQDLENQKAGFLSAVDSIHKETDARAGEKEKAGYQNLLQNFALEAERVYRLAKGYSSPARDSSALAAGGAELDQLKAMLVQKETKIAELERQKQQAENEKNTALASLAKAPASVVKQATQKNDPEAAEWKEKYNKLKAATEKSASQIDALKTSYREAVEDNRRLLAQLQAIRSGKN